MEHITIRINSLVPSGLCTTRGGVITKWMDARPQPSEEELLAVDVAAIVADKQAKKQETADELSNNILAGKTFSDVDNYIDNQFTAASTVPEIKAVLIKLFKVFGRLILAIAKKQGLTG